MSALSRTAGAAAFGRRQCLRIVGCVGQQQVRTFWGRSNDPEWPKRFAKKLGSDSAAWEKHIERVSKEMDAQRQAMMERLSAYANKQKSGRDTGESDRDEANRNYMEERPSSDDAWFDPFTYRKTTVGKSGGGAANSQAPKPEPATPPLSEAKIKHLVQTKTQEILDTKASEAREFIETIVAAEVTLQLIQLPDMQKALDDWAKRNPQWLQDIKTDLAKSKSEHHKESMERMRQYFTRDHVESVVKDMIENGHIRSTQQVKDMVGYMIEEEMRLKDEHQDEVIRDVVRDEVHEQTQNLEMDTAEIRDIMQEEIRAFSQGQEAPIRRIVSDILQQQGAVGGGGETKGALAKMRLDIDNSLNHRLGALQAEICAIRDSISSADEQRVGEINRFTMALAKIRDAMNVMKAEAAGTMRAIATEVCKNTMRAQPGSDRDSSSKATSTAKSDHTQGRPAERLEPALDRQLADSKTFESVPSSSRTPPLSYLIVHHDAATGRVRVETPVVPGDRDSSKLAGIADVGVGQSELHEKLKSQGYRVLCQGDDMTFFARGAIGLGGPGARSDYNRHDRRPMCGRDVRTAILAAIGVYIVYRVHCASQNDTDKRGKRVFKSYQFGNSARPDTPGQEDAWADMFREFEKLFGMVEVK